MKRDSYFFIWMLPLIWAPCTLGQFWFPGAHMSLYVIGSMAGTWMLFLVRLSRLGNFLFPLTITLVGVGVLALVGYVMDKAGIRRRPWALVFALCALCVFAVSVLSQPTIDIALRRHGSWWAYVFFSLNMGIYISVFLSVVLANIASFFTRGNGKKWELPEVFDDNSDQK